MEEEEVGVESVLFGWNYTPIQLYTDWASQGCPWETEQATSNSRLQTTKVIIMYTLEIAFWWGRLTDDCFKVNLGEVSQFFFLETQGINDKRFGLLKAKWMCTNTTGTVNWFHQDYTLKKSRNCQNWIPKSVFVKILTLSKWLFFHLFSFQSIFSKAALPTHYFAKHFFKFHVRKSCTSSQSLFAIKTRRD